MRFLRDPRCAEGSAQAVRRGVDPAFTVPCDARADSYLLCGSDFEEGVGGAAGRREEFFHQYIGVAVENGEKLGKGSRMVGMEIKGGEGFCEHEI